jgi:cytochrome c-type protein NapC
MGDQHGGRGRLRRTFDFLRRPSARYSVASLFIVGCVAGIIFWGGFNTALEATNQLEFCISCHEMRDTVFQEYKETIHYKNRVGVRAICSDCHVPRDWTHKMVRKMRASFEIWGKLTGSINTPEKFEATRLRLAQDEWARMRASDSRECRNCHSFEAMDLTKQEKLAQRRHNEVELKSSGKTCIDCHQGIAHHLPKQD